MKNIMEIDGHKAVIAFDADIGMFRGEFLGLSGSADFYAADVEGLLREGRTSLKVYLQACEERGITPYKRFSGKFLILTDSVVVLPIMVQSRATLPRKVTLPVIPAIF